jgi:hypothetical protein
MMLRVKLTRTPGVPFEETLPVRPVRFGKGLRSFAGWWYSVTMAASSG